MSNAPSAAPPGWAPTTTPPTYNTTHGLKYSHNGYHVPIVIMTSSGGHCGEGSGCRTSCFDAATPQAGRFWPCSSMKQHMERWCEAMDQFECGPNGRYGPKPTPGEGKQYPRIYMNQSQFDKLKSELAMVAVTPMIAGLCTGPVICTRCKMKNDYGAANQKDGTYKCWECR